MRRIVYKALAAPRFGRHSSYVAGMFNFRVDSEEIYPFPTHKLDVDESDNLQTLIEQIRGGDKEMNAAGARIAAEYGGLGLGHTAHALVCEEIGTSGDARLLATLQHASAVSYLLSTAGSSEIKGKYLTAMSDGSVMMGWAAHEEFGNDISMNNATANFVNGNYLITGTKACFFAESSTHFLVLAKTLTQTPGENGPTEAHRNSFFIVKKDAEGVVVKGDQVTFSSTQAADVVGVVGEGFKDHMVTLFTEQYVYCAALLGVLKRVVQELRDSVPDKWAATIIGSCACLTYAMESALYALTANLDAPTQDSLLEAALVSAFVQSSTNEWLTMLSTATPTTEPLEGCFASARRLLAMMESSDFLHATAVSCGVEDYGLYFQRSSTFQIFQARAVRSIGIKPTLKITEVDCSLIDNAIVKFGEAVEMSYVRNTTRLPHQQLILNRLGEAAAFLYAATAAASRASMCASKRLPTAKMEKELTKAFIVAATSRANGLSSECRNPGLTADDMYTRIALEMCEDALQ